MLRGGCLLLCVFGRRAGAFAEVEMGGGRSNRVGDEKGVLVGCEPYRTEDVGANKSRLGSSPVNTMRPMTVKFLCHLWSYLKCERRLTLTPYPISRLMV